MKLLPRQAYIRILKIHDEDALIEMRTSEAVSGDPDMQALDEKAGDLLDSLPPTISDER